MAFIEVKNVSYKYPTSKNEVLTNVSFSVEKGEFCSIIGSNGSGKTTICNVLRGFIPSFFKGELKGEIIIDGKNINDYSEGELASKVGFVFQNPFIQISGVKDTVYEEIAYGLENLGIEVEEIHKRVENMMRFLQIEYLKDKNPMALSGGQKQRIALASILVMEPDVLIIDEPTSQLDPQGTEEVFETIKLMKEMGKTIILVEHKIELIAQHSDKIVVMNKGKKVLDGNSKEILSNKKLLEYNTYIPQYAMLGLRLKEEGMDIKEIPILEEEAIKECKRLIEERKRICAM